MLSDDVHECCSSTKTGPAGSGKATSSTSDGVTVFGRSSDNGRFAGMRLGGPEIFLLPLVRPRLSDFACEIKVFALSLAPEIVQTASEFDSSERSRISVLALLIELFEIGRNMGQGRSALCRDGLRIRDANGAG